MDKVTEICIDTWNVCKLLQPGKTNEIMQDAFVRNLNKLDRALDYRLGPSKYSIPLINTDVNITSLCINIYLHFPLTY